MNDDRWVVILIACVILTIFGSYAIEAYFKSDTLKVCYEASKTNTTLKCEK